MSQRHAQARHQKGEHLWVLSRGVNNGEASPEEPRVRTKCGLEAPGGFEPPHRSFADCSLTTWVRRLKETAL